MNLYDKKTGYLDWPDILKHSGPLLFMTGARGIGKSFGCVKYFLDSRIPFLYMRRLQTEADLQQQPETSDLEKIFQALGISARYEKIAHGKICRVIDTADEREICEVIALSTFAGIRSVNFDRFDWLIYDEFIPEPHIKKIKMEGFALQQALESIGRNRELEGRPPLRLVALSNSLNLANDIFIQFDLVETAEKLFRDEQSEIAHLGDRTLILPRNSPISRRKASTMLYRNASEEFSRMAIRNEFVLNDMSYVHKRPIREFVIRFRVGDLYVYRHKTNGSYYVTFTKSPTKNAYETNKNDLERLRREKRRFWWGYLDGKIRFESYRAVALFEEYFGG